MRTLSVCGLLPTAWSRWIARCPVSLLASSTRSLHAPNLGQILPDRTPLLRVPVRFANVDFMNYDDEELKKHNKRRKKTMIMGYMIMSAPVFLLYLLWFV